MLGAETGTVVMGVAATLDAGLSTRGRSRGGPPALGSAKQEPYVASQSTYFMIKK